VTGTVGSLAVGVLVSLVVSCTPPASTVAPRPIAPDGATPISSAPSRQLADIPFKTNNELPDCISVTATGGKTVGNLLLGAVRVETKKIIADCGCPSRWLIYRAIRNFHGYQSQQVSGIVVAPEPGGPPRNLDLVLEADNEHPEAGFLTVDVSCRPPD
jgi:hypothetical protein